MEKINLNELETQDVIVKLGKNKIKVRPYITTTEKTQIADLCLQQMDGEGDTTAKLCIVKTLYDMVVAALCTNVSIVGVKIKSDKQDKTSIEIDIKKEEICAFEKTNIAEVLRANIYDYNVLWDIIFEVIKLNNKSADLMRQLSELTPNDEAQKETVAAIAGLVKDFSEKNPQAVKDTINKKITQKAKAERITEKNNAKSKSKQ